MLFWTMSPLLLSILLTILDTDHCSHHHISSSPSIKEESKIQVRGEPQVKDLGGTETFKGGEDFLLQILENQYHLYYYR